MSLGVISVSDESSYSALPPVPSLIWQIKKKHPRYFNKKTQSAANILKDKEVPQIIEIQSNE